MKPVRRRTGECLEDDYGIDADKIGADFKDGVLTISLPEPPELQHPERKIAIQSR
jgi:HSP20 family molecular chaperone IbpA